MNTKHPKLYFLIFLGAGLFFMLGLAWSWFDTINSQQVMSLEDNFFGQPKNDLEVLLYKKKKPEKITVKGIYLTGYSAGREAKVDEVIDLIEATELNAVVIDIKDYTGYVLYDSNVELVNELDLENDLIGDVSALIKKLHEHNIYVVARQTVFQDPILARKKTEWAIKRKSGGVWRDDKGLSWVDPTKQEIWDYNVSIAKEAISLGFDEINFDYVRFPTDGNLSQVVYTNGEKTKNEVISDFFKYLSDNLSQERAWISIDVFGFVMERQDGMSIGQTLTGSVDYVDYICPMMYPSHYPSGHLKLANPAAHPSIVIENGMQKGIPYFENKRAKARPWIQAFDMGAVYDAGKIRAQIDMVEKYSDGGWMLWNAANRYTSAGLKQNVEDGM